MRKTFSDVQAQDDAPAWLQALGGVPVATLVERYGTPLLVLDTDRLRLAADAILNVSRPLGLEVAYAAKAFFCVALAKLLAGMDIGLDVCSLGELVTAERAGFPIERLTLHGCGKTRDELAAAAGGRVGRIVVDGREELEALASLAPGASGVAVLLRINSGVVAATHDLVRTAGDDTKFGFSPTEVPEAAARIRETPHLRLLGLHAHVGSQVFDPATFCAHAEAALLAYSRVRGLGFPLGELVLGGGFGVADLPPDDDADVGAILSALVATVERSAAARNVPLPRLGIEPGRALVGRAGTTLYRVLAVKTRGSRRFAIVDGGVYENPRPALYGSYHHPVLAARASSAALIETTVCGRSCENDELATARLPHDIVAGDVLALQMTGAYTFSMASNYNRFVRPAAVFAGGLSHRLVIRRETEEDVLRQDVLAG
ncbi:MAG: diaminopimelate decarboxylase [Candidatus Baltobacteraceae bacterium]